MKVAAQNTLYFPISNILVMLPPAYYTIAEDHFQCGPGFHHAQKTGTRAKYPFQVELGVAYIAAVAEEGMVEGAVHHSRPQGDAVA